MMGPGARGKMRAKKKFLFLQGCTCPFFHVLGRRLRERGHGVGRVNFNVGDALFWRGGTVWNYRWGVKGLADFLRDILMRHGYTDVVMLGDTRPIHVVAVQVAAGLGLVVHVWEEGYFRPNWLTLERGGINGYSRLPREPEWYRGAARHVPDLGHGERVPNPVRLLAWWELAYHLPGVLNPVFFPGYRTHRPAISGVEFAGWAWRFARMPLFERRDRRAIQDLLAARRPFYLLPLQLDGDSQITHHSPFADISQVIRTVLTSFASNAPSDTWLVIKNHPLDTGLTDYRRVASSLVRSLDLEGRILYLETGSLSDLLPHTRGVVTVNSTVGITALASGRPVIALGKAIYDLPGLTFQGGLDRFWREAGPPDGGLFLAFRRVVIHATQVNGGFYSRRGCRLAVENALRFLEPERSPLEELLA